MTQSDRPEEALACSLSAGERVDRRGWLRSLRSHALTVVRETDGVTVRFPARADLEDELRALAAAEAECCSFLSLTVERSGGALELRVAGPPEARPIVEELFGAGS